MKVWLIAILATTAIIVNGQDSLAGIVYSVDSLNVRDDRGKKHGWWVHTYNGNRLKSTIYYEHGKKQRYAHYYYKDGRLKMTGFWCENLKDGWWTYYHKRKPEKVEQVQYNSKKVVQVIKVWDYSNR